MASLIEEVWTYEDDRVSASVVKEVPTYLETGMGILRIYVIGSDHHITIPVPVSPHSPTESDDMEWFTLVNLYREDV